MKSLGSVFVIILLLGFAGVSLAQYSQPSRKAPPPSSSQTQTKQLDIIQALGKLKLEEVKKAVPRGTESTVRPEPGSRLATVGAVTRFQEPSGDVSYYFNRAGILVSAQSKAKRLISKEQLEREIKGLTFKKFPPTEIMAAFARRSPQVVQGFYLGKDGRYVEYTTFDYMPGR
jgi:hypothetical protein